MQLTFILYHGAGASILLSNLYLHHHKILKRFVTLTNLIGAYLPPFNEEEKLKKNPKRKEVSCYNNNGFSYPPQTTPPTPREIGDFNKNNFQDCGQTD